MNNNIKNQIQEELKDNCNSILDIKKKIKIIEENLIDVKINKTLSGAIIPYTLLLNIIPHINSKNIIPTELIQPLTFMTSLTIGLGFEEYFNYKLHLKEKLKSFSNAKNQKDLLLEYTRYKIELNKLMKYNSTLNKLIRTIISDKTNENQNHADYTPKISKEEIKKKINDLKNTIKSKYKDIDIASTKHFLINEYNKINNNINNYNEEIILGITSGITIMSIYNLPNYLNKSLLNIKINNNIYNYILPFSIGTILNTKHYIKKKKEYLNSFKKLNNELNSNIDYNNKSIKELENIYKKIDNIYSELIKRKYELSINESKIEEKKNDELSTISNEEYSKEFDEFLENLTNYLKNSEEAKNKSIKKRSLKK